MKNIGLIGFGCVGQGLARYFEQQPHLPYRISGIAIKRIGIPRIETAIPITYNPYELIESESIDLIVEVIDDADAALKYVTAALLSGKDVITANKKMVARNLGELLELQSLTGRRVWFEAAVGGSIPIISLLAGYYKDEPLMRIRGILNGTSNYVLTKIFNENLDYQRSLRQAQKLGFAESDPTNDVSGKDAWYKSKLLAYQAFGVNLNLDSIFHYGIQYLTSDDIRYARSKNKRIKLVPIILPTLQGIVSWVVPQFIGMNDPFYAVDNEYNSIEIDGQFVGKQHLTGKGAGALPTAGALFGDIQRAFRKSELPHHSGTAIADPSGIQLEVYIRDRQVLSNSNLVFDQVQEGYLDDSYHYLIGLIGLDRLIELKPWLESRQCTVIATGNYRITTKATPNTESHKTKKAVI